VRYLADGNLEFMGRTDDQVKLRGFRIELGEIESALIEQASIRDAAAVLRADDGGDEQLVAYVVPAAQWIEPTPLAVDDGKPQQPLHHELIPELRQQLRQRLPAYMLPSAFVVLDALPLNPNGKVDRNALPAPGDAAAGLGTEYAEPRSDLEKQMAQTWADVLKIERVGIHDNFFELGGHSLMAMQVVSRIVKDLRVELPVAELFVYPTVAELAHRLESGQWPGLEIAAGSLERIARVEAEIIPANLEALSDQQVAELLSELSATVEDYIEKP
jgi:acyl carrier protein